MLKKYLSKTIFICLLSLSLFNMLGNGQGRFEYVKKQGVIWQDKAEAIVNDASGNLYMTGMTEPSSTVFFVSKFDQNGNLLWQYLPGGGGTGVTGTDIALDTSGNIYVTLYIYSPSNITINTDTLEFGSHVVKLDNSGNVLWHKFLCPPGYQGGHSKLKVSPAGNVYVAGTFSATMIVDNDTVTAYGSSNDDVFLVKFNTAGVCQWLRHGGTAGTDGIYGVGIDNNENITLLASVYYFYPPVFGGLTLTSAKTTVYVRYDSLGTAFKLTPITLYQSPVEFSNYTQCPDGEIFACGTLIGQGVLGNDTLNSQQAGSCFITKIDTSGFPVFSKIAGSIINYAYTLQPFNIVADSHKNIYIEGLFGDTLTFGYYFLFDPNLYGGGFFLTKTDSAFNTKWSRSFAVNQYFSIYKYDKGLSTDANDNIYFACNSEGNVIIGTTAFSGNASADIYYGKIGPGFENNIHGNVYNDDNGNSHFDPNESVAAGKIVLQLPDSIYFLTDVNGNYAGEIDSGNYFLKYVPAGNEFVTQPYNSNVYPLTISMPQSFPNGFDFGYTDNTLSGNVYWDNNSNCLFDGTDQHLAGRIAEINPGHVYCSTNQQGFYTAGLDTGSYQVKEERIIHPYQLQNCTAYPYIYSLHIDSLSQKKDSIDFADALVPNITDVRIVITGARARHGFNTKVNLTYENIGTIPVSGSVTLLHDDSLTYVSSSIPYDTYINKTLTFNYSNLQLYESRDIEIEFTVDGNIGTTLESYATIFPVSTDADTLNNRDSIAQPVTNAFDPNEKLVSQTVMDTSEVNSGKYLVYTIYFQNTGNDTAQTIIIADTLDSNLQPASFEMLSSSHPATFNMRGNGIITFRFDNILLPDSNVNEPASHGFVKYRIRPDYNLNPGTVISNTAFIYFDFNAPVLTNTTATTIVVSTGAAELNNRNTGIKLIPNPAGNRVTVFLNSSDNYSEVSLTNITGEVVFKEKLNNVPYSSIPLDIKNISSGIYIVNVLSNSRIYHAKLIIGQH